ncbi:hypothetical protein GCK32_012309 [Trichostrongylus colubriformis]|uniref:Uncharacterized protein n=1 Tax=Trichostrongylus colubriformis TaxID=6319 RepID=A0AAN8F818_TRICO
MCILRHVLICSAVFNLLTFLTGLFLGMLREDLLILSLVLTIVGLLGMLLFAVTWQIRPKAIQYSMEATYYRDVLSEMGEGVVRTSVIHTAPGCTSVLDSESEDETEKVKITPRNSAEEQWLPFGESWRNEQLRLSLERGSSNLLVFPYCEASPHGERGSEAVEHDFSRIESIKRPHGYRGKSQANRQQFQVRCIGMSASFIERFNNSFRASSFQS